MSIVWGSRRHQTGGLKPDQLSIQANGSESGSVARSRFVCVDVLRFLCGNGCKHSTAHPSVMTMSMPSAWRCLCIALQVD